MAWASVKLNNGALMPSVALGTWKSKKGEVGNAVKIALANGYKHIDCAHVYANEDEVGETLTSVFNEGKIKREDLFIVSKLWCNSHAAEDVLPACQTTLKNLQLKYLDLYLIHLPCSFKKESPFPHSIAEGTIGYNKETIKKTWEAMEKLVEQGLCKAIGISNFTIKKITDLLEGKVKIVPACNQVELHPYLPQPELFKFCNSKGILLTAYSPLGSPDRPFGDKSKEPVLLQNPVLLKIAEKHNTTSALVALAWGIKRGTPVLPKAVSEGHIKENIKALDLKLDEDDMKAIGNIGINHRYLPLTWMYKPEEVPEDFWDEKFLG
ncbi:aldo-keto reductase family 1 member B1-like isoform X2 [Acropora millepora]|uniref:aldo-keto reductase family 1 member B1-like isoform X1 n=1 Tax=Acropora millepora TaxID=45264 RepID=UPI0010FCC159|nr:aldo-keto reductase family 1 member B1-like isoform X1 [Acropora millepora]XP_044178552.1 aldo-keto reductase family 1 member B1-like isoform X2 [Acropora millepora]